MSLIMKTKILYIEDDPVDRKAFVEFMSSHLEIEYSISSTIQQGIARIKDEEFDLIFTDFSLPDGNAFDIIKLNLNIPVIVITGMGNEAVAVRLIKSGASDYLIKDIDNNYLEILPHVIEKTLNLKKAEQAKALLAAIIETAGDAIFSIDANDKIYNWNNGAKQIYGYEENEILGLPFSFLLRNSDDAGLFTEMVKKVKEENKTIFREMVHRTKDGKMINIDLSISPLSDKAGEINSFSIIGRDITLYKKNKEALMTSKIELEHALELQRKKDEFVGIASHELKTPLTSLKAQMQVLEMQLERKKIIESSEALDYVRKTNININRLQFLLTSLLDVSKIQTGQLDFNFETFDFNQMAKECIENMKLQDKKHEIILEGSIQKNIRGDRSRLTQVLTNYLTNAIKYSPDSNKIIVKVKEEKDNVVVSVQDFGIGVSTKDMGHLFERFYRANLDTHKFTGLGIGLFVSKQIIKGHEGRVWAESQEGKGSTFYFSVPIGDSQND